MNILIFATCQGASLQLALKSQLSLSGLRIDYLSNYLSPGVPRPLQEVMSMLDSYDLLIYHPTKQTAGIREFNKKLKYFSFPYLTSKRYWPNFDFKTMNNRLKITKNRPYGIFPWRDYYVEEIFDRLGGAIDDTINEYMKSDLCKKLDLPDTLEAERLHYQALSSLIDFDIIEFIESFIYQSRLFHLFNHPAEFYYDYLVSQLAVFVGFRKSKIPENLLAATGNLQMPIHPSIAHSLGIDFWCKSERIKIDDRFLSIQDYYREYLNELNT